MGSINNKLIIEYLSPWFNFKDKNDYLTKALYVYDPKFYDPKKPTSRARKLLGEDETIILGNLRNKIYFSQQGDWDNQLEPQHLSVLRAKDSISLKNLSKYNVELRQL